ncbi:MAG: DUF1850 domain-containing protein [Syntrophaceae bacterium]|nr:DUF1850 domain-containing protein [Syntrophaceae bacterium]
MNKKRWGYLLLIITLTILLYPFSFIEVETKKNRQTLLLKKVSPGDQFEFRYIHSVDRTPVVGFFLITSNGTIKPIETHFSSYGPGLPCTAGHVYREGEKMIAKPESEDMDCFSFFISPATNQSVTIKNERLDFSSLREGEVVKVTVKRYSWGKRMLRYGRK